mgnify:CR=1 FL=1
MANIELDGVNKKIKVDSGDLTLDVPGDIILDADGADLVFADGGTNILKVTNSSSDVVFQPQVDAKDIIFKQYDGTTVATVEDNGTFNIPTDKLAINGTAVTSTAAELNILDGVTATATELNLIDGVTATTAELNIVDGNTSATSTTIADADRVVLNDNGTMVQAAVTDLKTYIGGAGLVFIKRLTGDSNVSSLDFDNTMSSTYDGYLLQVRQLGTTTDQGNIYLRVVNDSGTVKDNGGYNWSRITMEAGNSTLSTGQGEGAQEGYLATDMNDGSGTLMSGTYTIINKSDENTARRFKCFGNVVQYDGTQSRFEQGTIGFEYASAETIRGFYIYPQSGNLNYVDVALYGVKNS